MQLVGRFSDVSRGFQLFRYLYEKSYRFNNRRTTDAERFEIAVREIVGNLMFDRPTNGEGRRARINVFLP